MRGRLRYACTVHAATWLEVRACYARLERFPARFRFDLSGIIFAVIEEETAVPELLNRGIPIAPVTENQPDFVAPVKGTAVVLGECRRPA
ncbi:MAG: hypothetical protein CMJ62_18080 [Planctomycetaceae bacterium]|nr:hypothetical protein [Planctomycetaceae bacterium]